MNEATHDLTITHAHRTALRRVETEGVLGDLFDLRTDLLRAGLIQWGFGGFRITDEGRALLAAHDRLADTRRVERPRLEPKPLPAGWRLDLASGYVHTSGLRRMWSEDQAPGELEAALAKTRDTLALLEWIAHSRAVEAQEASS